MRVATGMDRRHPVHGTFRRQKSQDLVINYMNMRHQRREEMGHSHDSRQGAWEAGGQVNNQDLQHRYSSGTKLCFGCATLPLLAAARISMHGVVSRPDSSVPEAGKSEARVPACLGFLGALPGCRLGLPPASSLARMTRQLPRVFHMGIGLSHPHYLPRLNLPTPSP